MATTLTTLLAAVRRFLDEATAGTWSDADLTTYINDSERQIWAEMAEVDESMGLRESTAVLTQANQDYALPGDCLGRNVRSLFTYDASDSTAKYRRVQWATIEEVIEEGRNQKDYPTKYTVLDGYIKVGPPPSSAGMTIRMVYTRRPTVMSAGGDYMDSDDVFAEAIAIGAAIRALERTGVDTSAMEKRQQKALSQSVNAVQPNEPRFAKNRWDYQ